jgi:hypothetical protein
MSRSSKNIVKNNNLNTSSGRFVTKRSAGVFDNAPSASAVDSVFLYKLVFTSKKAALVAILLCICFATQSVQFAEANEEEPAVAEVQVEEVQEPLDNTSQDQSQTDVIENATPSEPTPTPEQDNVAKPSQDDTQESELDEQNATEIEADTTTNEPVNEISDEEINPDSQTKNSEQSVSSEAESEEEGGAVPVTQEVSVDSGDIQTAEATEEVDSKEPESDVSATTSTSDVAATSSASSTEQEFVSTATTTEPDDEQSSGQFNSSDADSDTQESESTQNADSEVFELSETSGSSSDEVDYVAEPPTTSNENLVFTVESDTHFSFNKNECIRVEDGSFYCQEQDGETVLEDSLMAAPDSDGDLEIYLVRDGERYQVTHNEVDDASPYYDELSNTIVWHRLLNDRYQIISYDIESGEEEQLTQTTVNNMEPARHGGYTVWQRWVENNWEVILFNGETETQITDSARHDIAPHIRGPLVIWNSQSNDGSQELKTFDIQSRTQTTIADSEGVSVSNPRMVVMYEAMYENGDTVTKGFDLVSGKIVPLQALPKQLPEELPNSEPTEETRALIQSKPEPKATVVSNVQPSGGNGTSTVSATSSVTNAQTATSTTADSLTLDLRAMSTPELVEHLTKSDRASSTIPDVVIEKQPATSTDSGEQAGVVDLVLPSVDDIENIGTSTQNKQE